MKDIGMFTSVTGIVSTYFPFDAPKISEAIARRDGIKPEEVLEKWKMAAQLGTNTHAYIESLIKKEPFEEPKVLHGNEPVYYKAADQLVKRVLKEYDPIAVELMVCSPKHAIAGTVDFIGRHKKSGKVLVADWKTSASTAAFRFGSFDEPCAGMLNYLHNTKINSYGLQLALYSYLIRSEGYSKVLDIPEDFLQFAENLEHKIMILAPAPASDTNPDSGPGTAVLSHIYDTEPWKLFTPPDAEFDSPPWTVKMDRLLANGPSVIPAFSPPKLQHAV